MAAVKVHKYRHWMAALAKPFLSTGSRWGWLTDATSVSDQQLLHLALHLFKVWHKATQQEDGSFKWHHFSIIYWNNGMSCTYFVPSTTCKLIQLWLEWQVEFFVCNELHKLWIWPNKWILRCRTSFQHVNTVVKSEKITKVMLHKSVKSKSVEFTRGGLLPGSDHRCSSCIMGRVGSIVGALHQLGTASVFTLSTIHF